MRSRVGKFEKRGKWHAAKTMLGQFASHEVGEFPVELEIARPGEASQRHQGLTDGEGFVHFDIRLDPARRPRLSRLQCARNSRTDVR